ncbi:MAG: TfoX/Sxy family protein [Bryobacterales bacterium]|nr:TfoX/Sxy family protein [Bryobacterales bacterium]
MAFDERLADRIRAAFPPGVPYTEKKMFGGLSFLVGGKMCCGVLRSELVVRVGAAAHADALAQPHARVMDFTGRPLRGFVQVAAEGLRTPARLTAWIQRGLACPADSPAKKKRIR